MPHHDLIIENGSVWMPNGYVVDEPVWIQDGRIAGVGVDQTAAAGHTVGRLDAERGLVLPGFQDGHIHPHHWAVRQLGCDLSEAQSGEDALERIAQYGRDHVDRPWITGGGWVLSLFGEDLPTKEMLDRVLQDRPAFFPYTDGHGAWANSRALELAGIDANTPDPANGRINRLPSGEPTGILEESAMDLVARHIPEHSSEELDGAFLGAYQRLLSWGVVAWQDAMVGRMNNWPENFDSYVRLAGREMKSHVVGALLWDPSRGLEQIDEFIEKREESRSSSPNFAATAVKIFQDGVIENATAGLIDPYLDRCGHQTANDGLSIIDPQFLKEIAAALTSQNFQVHFHALGDRAVREALDAIEFAQSGKRQDLRHTIAHIQVIDPTDVQRFAQLGVVANSQELWACHEPEMDLLTVPLLGSARSRRQYPFGALLSAGATIAGGSDWPVSTADPIQIIHTAVNRAAFGATEEDARPFHAEQALSLSDALKAHTRGVAYLNHDDHRSGTIDVGKSGDLVVLDRDLFSVPSDEIGAASVRFTVIGGEVVYGS